MHELSITRSVVSLCAERARGRRVHQVRLRIGRLAGIEVEAVKFCFDVCAQGTELEGARLVIEDVAGRGECGVCGASLPMTDFVEMCGCGASAPLKVVAGEEMQIVDIELEDE